MKDLLRLQELDLQIEQYKERETDVPKRKNKLEVHKNRLRAEVAERDAAYKRLQIDQRESETDLQQLQEQIVKYQNQLLKVKRNEEYQALVHEIDNLKKQLALKEERVIAILLELDEARARVEEDRKRIHKELEQLDRECAKLDQESAETIQNRQELEEQRGLLAVKVEVTLYEAYQRIRSRLKSGPAVVPLRSQFCSGCNMSLRPQLVNEVLAGHVRPCNHCGRLLYDTVVLEQLRRGVSEGED